MSRTSEPAGNSTSAAAKRHLAVGGPRQRGHVVHPMVAQPGQRGGADLGLPGVPFGFLQQPDMRPQQRMHGDLVAPARAGPGAVAASSSWRWVQVGNGASTSRPPGYEHGEVHRGTGAVQIGDEAAQRRAATAARAAGWPARLPGCPSLRAVCSTARVSSGCGDNSAKTR